MVKDMEKQVIKKIRFISTLRQECQWFGNGEAGVVFQECCKRLSVYL